MSVAPVVKRFLIVFCTLWGLQMVQAQIPSFGGCAEYQPMVGFNREKFMGTWFEQERYFTLSELAAKCISATYERRVDGKLYVDNAITNRFTNVQRIVTGEILTNPSKRTPGQFNVRYSGVPISYESTLTILDTDYKSYAVVWSCNRLGPIGHTDTFWVMTRKRIETGPAMQRAYGVLDKFKISRTFFLKTDQTTCETVPEAQEAIDPTPTTPAAGSENEAAVTEVNGDVFLDAVLLEGVNVTELLNTNDNKNATAEAVGGYDEIGAEDSLIQVGGSEEAGGHYQQAPPKPYGNADVLSGDREQVIPINSSGHYRNKPELLLKSAGANDVGQDEPAAAKEAEAELPITPIIEALKNSV